MVGINFEYLMVLVREVLRGNVFFEKWGLGNWVPVRATAMVERTSGRMVSDCSADNRAEFFHHLSWWGNNVSNPWNSAQWPRTVLTYDCQIGMAIGTEHHGCSQTKRNYKFTPVLRAIRIGYRVRRCCFFEGCFFVNSKYLNHAFCVIWNSILKIPKF